MSNETQRSNAGRAARGKQRARPGHMSNAKPSRASGDQIAQSKRNYDRYMALARDAASGGDAIEAENFYQHAEHYLRTMREHLERRHPAGGENNAVAAS